MVRGTSNDDGFLEIDTRELANGVMTIKDAFSGKEESKVLKELYVSFTR